MIDSATDHKQSRSEVQLRKKMLNKNTPLTITMMIARATAQKKKAD